jgi:cell division protein FtsB
LLLYHEAGLRGFVFEKSFCLFRLYFIKEACGTRRRAMHKRNYLKTDRSSRKSRKKTLLIVAGSLLVFYLLMSFILGEMGLIKYYRMKAQYDSLTKEISSLRQDNDKLLGDVHALKTDPDRMEQIARDKLGLARPGEIVYYYSDP